MGVEQLSVAAAANLESAHYTASRAKKTTIGSVVEPFGQLDAGSQPEGARDFEFAALVVTRIMEAAATELRKISVRVLPSDILPSHNSIWHRMCCTGTRCLSLRL